jgi:hypothetical protein
MKRILCAAALLTLVSISAICNIPARAETDTVVLRAQGNPNLIDFFALSEKRSNLRVAIVTKGLDAAFSEWLRQERPYVYRQYAGKKQQGGPTADGCPVDCCRSRK